MKLNELRDQAHDTALRNGWWSEPRGPLCVHMLIVSEVAEATEAVRSGLADFFTDQDSKPQGEATELADAIIRIADYFGKMGWDLEQMIKIKLKYNKGRPYRHGKKF